METEKALGYVLLFLGIAMMLTSLLMLFSVFTGAMKPPELFNLQKQKTETTSI